MKSEPKPTKTAPRKHGAVLIALFAAVLIALPAAAYFLGVPMRYSAARAALDRGDYERAESLFSGLDYKDSAELSKQCVYLRNVYL